MRILFLCIGVLTVIGALDDQRELQPNMRFYAQILVAILLATIGDTVVLHVGNIFGKTRNPPDPRPASQESGNPGNPSKKTIP